MKLDTYKASAARKVLVYGAPKTGKTELVGSLAALDFRLWWFDLEDGIKTLLRPDSLARTGLSNIELFKIPDTQEFPVACATLHKVAKGGPLKICHKHGVVNCQKCSSLPASEHSTINTSEFTHRDILVIDSVSQLAASTMNQIGFKEISKSDEWRPDWEHYAKQGFLMDRIFTIFQQAPFNVVCVSHETMVEMEDKTKKLVPIGGTSNFSKVFAKYFDDCIYTEIVNGKFRAYSDASQKSSAIVGSRTGKKITEGKGLKELFE